MFILILEAQISEVHALQVNFADQEANLKDTDHAEPYRYTIQSSVDGKKWEMMVDKSQNKADRVDDYSQLKAGKAARYLKITSRQYLPVNSLLPASGFLERPKVPSLLR